MGKRNCEYISLESKLFLAESGIKWSKKNLDISSERYWTLIISRIGIKNRCYNKKKIIEISPKRCG